MQMTPREEQILSSAMCITAVSSAKCCIRRTLSAHDNICTTPVRKVESLARLLSQAEAEPFRSEAAWGAECPPMNAYARLQKVC